MSTQTTLPAPMPDIKAYLKGHPYLATLAAGRVFFRIPPRITKAPFLRIYRSGGGVQPNSEAPLSDIRIAIEVWGLQNSDYPAVGKTAAAIEAIALPRGTPPGTILGPGGTRAHNISVTTFTDSPDPDTGWPRMVGDTVWTLSF